MSYVLLGLGALLFYYTTTSVASWWRLRHYPGPFLATFSWIWLTLVSQSGHSDEHYLKVKRKYKSPLIRIAPDFLFTDNADIIRYINGVRSPYVRDDWYRGFTVNPYVPSMLSMVDEKAHHSLKSRTNPAYYGRDVPGLEAGLDSQILGLKNLIRQQYLSTETNLKPIDLSRSIQYCTYDAITRIGFGQEWGFLKANKDIDNFISTVTVASPFIQLCTDIPAARSLFMNKFMLKLMGPKYTDKTGLGNLMRVCREVVEKRFGGELGDGRDLLGSFIHRGLSKEECEAEIPTLVIAGSDTTAGVIRSGLLHLMTSHKAYQRLQSEIDDAIRNGKASSPITHVEAKELPYLQAVIWESMRICPPSQLLMPKVVPPGGDVLLGKYHVPAGTRIGVNAMAVQRDTEVFGEDVELFRPERFTEATPEKRLRMEHQVELSWGYGRYMCSGKLVAQMKMNKMFFELLRDFDFQLVNPQKPWTRHVNIVYHISDMWVKVTERENS
ncbi:Cytochrome P450 [Naviculisporaceae sp. PSN 640]